MSKKALIKYGTTSCFVSAKGNNQLVVFGKLADFFAQVLWVCCPFSRLLIQIKEVEIVVFGKLACKCSYLLSDGWNAHEIGEWLHLMLGVDELDSACYALDSKN